MAGDHAAREQAAARLRQRLWGATVLIALAVIVLPLLLDGSGSESQFRRVERLREEPPRIVAGGGAADATSAGAADRVPPPDEAEGSAVVTGTPLTAASGDGATARAEAGAAGAGAVGAAGAGAASAGAASAGAADAGLADAGTGEAPPARSPDIRVGEDDPPDYLGERAEETPPASARRPDVELPRAWVVQAGSFRERANALAVRDRLRRAGHPTFVTDASASGPSLYRVQVGPMVDEVQAERLRDEVIALLGREAIVVAYP